MQLIHHAVQVRDIVNIQPRQIPNPLVNLGIHPGNLADLIFDLLDLVGGLRHAFVQLFELDPLLLDAQAYSAPHRTRGAPRRDSAGEQEDTQRRRRWLVRIVFPPSP